jgi:hypothetical protein
MCLWECEASCATKVLLDKVLDGMAHFRVQVIYCNAHFLAMLLLLSRVELSIQRSVDSPDFPIYESSIPCHWIRPYRRAHPPCKEVPMRPDDMNFLRLTSFAATARLLRMEQMELI